jgi:ribosome-binding protein aMBF1 (putative translation factor)
MLKWEKFKQKLLKNEDVRKEYERLSPRYKIISEIIGARMKKKMSQEDLAKKVGTKQSAIARLESGNTNPSIDFLEKIAKATEGKLQVRIVQ